ncbi:alpha/beta hydrolase [Corynebacterium suranareeae]|uniref:Alpha/beta hydrolase n=1 Tax=Corynebacterium suranareeae TaxID=2506452 RepID=A0A160PRS0_9CORY|nr:alpha/beta hydrolase [Corynebacterium suranareeae]BAU95551.1 alpha/beta hydrolase [Corynebacterium suranareeae]
MSIHPDAQRFLQLASHAPDLDTQSVAENRAANEASRHLMGNKTPVAAVQDLEIDGIPVRAYNPRPDVDQLPVFIYFHGGGWVLGDLESVDSTVRDIAVTSGALCISVDYRRAPEHPFPAALDDCQAVTEAVLNGSVSNTNPELVAAGGDSAGGNIAAVIAQELRDRIVHQVLIYPVMNLSSFDTSSHQEFASGYFLTRRRLEYFYTCYAAEHDRSDPRLSPGLHKNLKNLPPATIVTAECDPLVDEVSDYAEALLKAGNAVTHVQFKGQVHPFVQMSTLIADALSARRFIGGELAEAFKYSRSTKPKI